MLSIWEKESFYAPQDVIIIGAGLMGLWSALELKKKNDALRITILERNTIPLGASTRNAGFACFGSPTELICDAETSGADNMLAVAEMRYKGIEKIRTYFADAVIAFDLCGGYECINKDYKYWDALNDRIAWLNATLQPITHRKNTFRRTDEKLATLGLQGFDCLLENKTEAALHSGKLVQALTSKVQSLGVTILYGMELERWENNKDVVSIYTKQNIQLQSHRLLFCTNGFTPALGEGLPVKPARGQVIVTSPIEGLALKGTFHYDEGFYYWRNLGNRVLLGGARNTAFEEEETTDLAGSMPVKRALEDFLKTHLHPKYQYTIEHHWSGIMGFTADKKPFVGQAGPNAMAAIACNGMGVALTPMIAEKVAAKLLADF
ncbi:FAD-binding oxidoreductase [Sediminibacterium roseum]|uniref:FAD-binding oxidoreductase n=1 Tax=Sediminibacterium roseum TaxID=1978412 RepID=A0ABW9ZX01_9BACT|nr:FAD-binding oxidoreductase [Sediminibacterium roseum]NCI50247.1 FAD-binding oxidoreductase [Sediminibacterium roseum]